MGIGDLVGVLLWGRIGGEKRGEERRGGEKGRGGEERECNGGRRGE